MGEIIIANFSISHPKFAQYNPVQGFRSLRRCLQEVYYLFVKNNRTHISSDNNFWSERRKGSINNSPHFIRPNVGEKRRHENIPPHDTPIEFLLHHYFAQIGVLQSINNVLKERHEIESNYKNLALKFRDMQEEEAFRRAKFDEARKKQLAELQAKGEALCREKAKLQHQIEHVTWHLEGCRRRRPCLARLPENCPLKGDEPSCLSHSPEKLKIMANMKTTADHLVRGIMDLRKKIHIVQDKLEHEVARKKDMEKKLAELRKQICQHNKCMQLQSHREHAHHHAHHHHHHHHGGGGGQSGTTSLPPIKNCPGVK
ncbi:ERC protein 2-like isoform X2 [Toxorhynchites rutilus septentrionalis]|uniref:ERC protein 2-like isoform X2 n=1 Tax=Toxorhynchites rutilus septentrionalis TaxID=329112 RepID=UPI0024793613|nr:ERC protein 2-like isoform X2 [Toxorhynchites rutilus septentrionalis]